MRGVKKSFGMRAWTEWEDEGIRLRAPESVRHYRKELDEDVRFYEFLQYLFYKQWEKFRGYVNSLGIKLFGDIPIYVAMDSADTWANPEVFWLDEERRPVRVAGAAGLLLRHRPALGQPPLQLGVPQGHRLQVVDRPHRRGRQALRRHAHRPLPRL